jgi:midasin (ATPase involved in ribosome maturation)
MCIIYLRVISKVPVIIMGETGCGKTSLIRFFSQNILNDFLEIFNIHAGITSKIIIEKMGIYIT